MTGQLDYIYLFYGLGFILLAAVCYTLGKCNKYSLPWMCLGLFGLIHGLHEWLQLLVLESGDSDPFRAVRACILAISFVFLLEFGRRSTKTISAKGPGRWVTVVLFMVGCTGYVLGWDVLNATLRYSLGFVGALWSAAAFVLVSGRMEVRGERRLLLALSGLFAAYAVASGLVVPNVPFSPASLINDSSFLRTFGFPIQLLRGLIAVGMATIVWYLLRWHNFASKRIDMVLFTTMMASLLVGGWFFTQTAGNQQRGKGLHDILMDGRLLADSIDPGLLDGLGTAKGDKDPRDVAIRQRFRTILERDRRYRWFYFMAQRGSQIVFTADSEPKTSKDYTPLGTVYSDAPDVLRAIFRGEQPGTTAEYSDKWGNWVSAFVPVRNEGTGKIIAVLGLDCSQQAFRGAIAKERLARIVITLLVMLLLILFYVVHERQTEALDQIAASEKALREASRFNQQIISSAQEGIIVYGPDLRYQSWNPVMEQLTGFSAEDVLGRHPSDVFHSLAEAGVIERLKRALAGDTPDAVEFPYGVPSTGVSGWISQVFGSLRNAEGEIIGVLAFVRDITALKQAEAYRDLSNRILNILNESEDFGDSAERVLSAIKESTGVDAVGMRLRSGDDFPYLAQAGFPDDFLLAEDTLVARGRDGGVCRDEEGQAYLECACGLVISGRTDPSNPLFTPGGSWWTNDSLPLLDLPLDEDPRLRPRNNCIHEGYRSLALVPVRAKGEIVGLLQLNGRRQNCFTLAAIGALEGIAASIGEALTRKQAEREIAFKNALLSAQQEASVDGILVVDSQDKILVFNHRFVEVWGLPPELAEPGPDEPVLKAVAERVADPAGFVARVRYLYEHRDETSHEEIPLADGRTLDRYSAPVLGPDGDYWGRVWYLRDITERIEMHSKLATERERLATTLRSIGDGVIAVDMNGLVRLMNPIAETLTGWEAGSAVGTPFREVFNAVQDASGERIDCPVEEVIRTGASMELADHTVLVSRDGTRRDIADSCAPIRDDGGNMVGVVLVFRDETERKRADSQIRLHAAAMNAADDLIAILDRDGLIVFANNAFQKQTGRSLDEIIGQDLSVLVSETEDAGSSKNVWTSIESGLAWSGEMHCKADDDSNYTADVTITPLLDNAGRAEHLIVIARNITERKVYEGLLDYQAHHDALTGLPNRMLFSEELATVVSDRRRKRGRCAVLFIDLDKFKVVNDSMGHQAGDALLVDVAARLGSCLRDGDTLARMGGDEFTVLLRSLESPEEAGSVGNRMLEQIAQPFEIGGGKLAIGASVGISIYPDNARSVEGLLKNADAAMYRAKELGRNNCQFYSEELNQTNLVRVETERGLRLAVKRDELKVYYQPIVDARTMKIVGAEALIRWEHPEKGFISPGLFVPVAEETGLIVQIGSSVLRTACAQAKCWIDKGFTGLEMSVNVSPLQLRRTGFVSEVLEILSGTGLPPQCLNLEITETVLAKNDYGEIDTLGRLNAEGIKTCLDDFGIGYSSLSRLKSFPIIHMKVDGSFIKDIEREPKDRAMTESIISMAHNLGIQVTAEWIENDEQLAAVRSLDCDFAQGYLISPALSPDEFEAFLRKWRYHEPKQKAA